jgi:allophanate hydrolase subunit 1
VPNPRHTRTRGVRVADPLWLAAQEVTAEQGETVTDVIVRGLDLYVRSHGYGVDPVTALERLHRLHTAGGLTDDEWRMKRRELLDRI